MEIDNHTLRTNAQENIHNLVSKRYRVSIIAAFLVPFILVLPSSVEMKCWALFSCLAMTVSNYFYQKGLSFVPGSARTVLLGQVTYLGHLGVILFFGLYSPIVILQASLIRGFSSHGLRKNSLAMVLHVTLVRGLFCVLFICGILRDPGVFNINSFSITTIIIVEVLVQCLFWFTYYSGRKVYFSVDTIMNEMEAQTRLLAKQDMLLLEAKQQMKAMAQRNDEGRFTGLILGNYKLGQLIGRGGMGEVYEAEGLEDTHTYAIKMLTGNPKEDTIRRFQREVKALQKIDSPFVVALHDAEIANSPAYLVMERLFGDDLETRLAESKRLNIEETTTMVEQVATGMQHAHDSGVLHRDLKPSNIFFCGKSKVWKILDFGISKTADQTSSLTGNYIVGTPFYMAPEYVETLEFDQRSDVFALAAIVYRALTGKHPFTGSSVALVLKDVMQGKPLRPGQLDPELTRFDNILAKGLAKDPDKRYQSIEAFKEDFCNTVVVENKVKKAQRKISSFDVWQEEQSAS